MKYVYTLLILMFIAVSITLLSRSFENILATERKIVEHQTQGKVELQGISGFEYHWLVQCLSNRVFTVKVSKGEVIVEQEHFK